MRLSRPSHTTRAAATSRAWVPPFLGAAVITFVLACGGAGEATGTGGGTGTGGDKLAASVTVSPSNASLIVGGTEQLTATPRDASGGVLTGRTVSWTSSSPTVASVVAGKVTGLSGGAATITATVDGRSSSAALTVKAAVAKVTLPAAPATFLVNQGISFAAVVTDASGNVLTGRTVTYTSSNTNVAVVQDGMVTAVAPGSTVITATCEGVSGSVTVTITSATSTAPVATVTLSPANLAMSVGSAEQVQAILRDAAGQSLSGRTVSWSSSQPSVATVANGVVTGVSVGTSTVTATSEGKSGTMLVSVVASSGSAAVATVTVSPNPATVDVGYTTQLTATLKDASGQVLTGRTVTWTSSDPAAASVSASGVVSGISFNTNSAGNVTITATSAEGKSGTARVGILAPASVASITLNPSVILTLAVNESATYTATVRDAGGTILTNRTVAWTSSNTNVATVSATGVVTAKATGTSNITASSGGKSASVQVVVQTTISRVDNVRMTPDSMLMQVAAPGSSASTRFIYAEPRDASYNLVSRPLTWTSSNPSVASVAGGVVSALSPGLATISATADGVTGTTKVRVFAYNACARFDMYPATTREASSIATGVWAIVRNADSILVQNKTVTWTSSNPAVVSIQQATTTVDPSGKYTSSFIPLSAGSATITASCDGMSGTIPVTVTAGQTVATITLTPNPLTIIQGMTGKPTLTLKDASGAQVLRTPAWSTGNSSIATVSVDGTVTGVSAGNTTLTASIDGKSATIQLSVTNESTVVASVVITPASPSIMVGAEVQFTATMKNAQGTVLSGKTVTWGSSNYLVGYQMNTTGLIYGREAGTSVISATSEGVTGTTVLTVGAPAAGVAYIGVTPTPSTIAVNGTVQLSAQLRDASGNILTGRTVTWTSANSAIATVGSAGLVTGKAAGTTTISASSGGVTGNATVTVTGTGGGGGGGGTGSVCSSVTSVGAPAPGNSTSWLPTQFKGIDYMISTSTINYGTQAAPKWGYTVTFRNRYTQDIGFSARGPVDYVPTSPFYAKTLGAGLTGATNTEYWSPPSTLWVYISGLRVGTTTGYCE